MNIAVLVPVTSNKRLYEKFEDTDLFKYLFKSFFTTYNPKYKYNFYIGIDEDDKFYQKEIIKKIITRFFNIMKNAKIKFIDISILYKGNVCAIWSKLYKLALDDEVNNNFFLQIGSDIQFVDKGWVDASINILQKNKFIGVVGMTDQGRKNWNKDDELITQSFVSRLHYDIFGFYFPPEIKNWGCDNWIGDIYDVANKKFIIKQRIFNMGGPERYEIPKDWEGQYLSCMKGYNQNINNFIHSIKS